MEKIDTNFHMLKNLLDDFSPAEEGIISGDEVSRIETMLHLNEMDVLQLRNLRDFTVLFILEKLRKMSDITSAITCVIDHHLVGLGAAV